ncbi:MAG: hypothetical protein GXN98_01615 [Euryarchaeota archaeon]|nr:hypothetical protein [Euryarchaeota archaeon]
MQVVTIAFAKGEAAPVLIGTIFYTGQRLLKGGRREFDRAAAERLIAQQAELAELTGLSSMLDLVLLSPEEVQVYIDFVAEVTDMPFAAGAAREELRLAAARYVAEVGLQRRYLHNSLSLLSGNPGEAEQLAELGVRSAILLLHSRRHGERLEQAERLVKLASRAGLRELLVDLGIVSLSGMQKVLEEGLQIRQALGVKVGCAPANATHLAREAVERLGGSTSFVGLDSAVHGVAAMYCDFLMYGAIEHAPWIFPAVAGVRALASERSTESPF